jgi:hypothetical protein
MLNKLIEDCNRLTREHNAGKRPQYPHWTDFVLLPLAREIGTRLNMQYSVSGVYGLRFVSYMKVFDDKSNYILSITPEFMAVGQDIIDNALKSKERNCMNELKSLHYDTGEDTKPWDANGFGCVTSALPDSVDEIIKILKGKGYNLCVNRY